MTKDGTERRFPAELVFVYVEGDSSVGFGSGWVFAGVEVNPGSVTARFYDIDDIPDGIDALTDALNGAEEREAGDE